MKNGPRAETGRSIVIRQGASRGKPLDKVIKPFWFDLMRLEDAAAWRQFLGVASPPDLQEFAPTVVFGPALQDYVWVKPSGCRRVFVQAWGGGGGGGGGAMGPILNLAGGAGGGGSAYACQWFDAADLPDFVDVHIGVGGLSGGNTWAGGPAQRGNPGLDGEDTWFDGYLFAYGGGGGLGGDAAGVGIQKAVGGGGGGLRGAGRTAAYGASSSNGGDGGYSASSLGSEIGVPGHGIFTFGSADTNDQFSGSGGGEGLHSAVFDIRAGHAIWGATGGGAGAGADGASSASGGAGGTNVFNSGGTAGGPASSGGDGVGGLYIPYDTGDGGITTRVRGSGTGAGGGGFVRASGDHSGAGGRGGFPGGGGGGGAANRSDTGSTGATQGGDGADGLIRVWSFF